MEIPLFPSINAFLNLCAGICLIQGFLNIRKKNEEKHRFWMISALICSTLFLTSYVTYHALHPGVTRYAGDGFMRFIYFFILLTHTPLAALIVPFVILAVYFAFKNDRARHRFITRKLFPAWLYVSITGVLIYLMLYILPQ
jgi:putative membrane protein